MSNSLASLRRMDFERDFNQKYGLRPDVKKKETKSYDNALYPDVPYDESLDPDTMKGLSDMFEILGLAPSQAERKADLDAAHTLLELSNPKQEDTSNALVTISDIQSNISNTVVQSNTQGVNITSLIIRLFTLIIRLPIECVRLFSTTENMNIIKNNIFNMIKQIICLIKIIISIPSRIGALIENTYTQIKYISLGTLVLLIITIMLYQTPITQPYMIFIFSVIQYLSGVDIPLTANDFAEWLKQQTIRFFAAKLAGKILTDAANSIASKVSTEVSTTVGKVLTDENTQRTILTALSSSPILAAASMKIAADVNGQLRILYDDVVSPQLQEIQDTVSGTSDRVEALSIDNAEMTSLFHNDFLLLQKTMLTIQNGQEINEEQLNEALVLIKRNLQTTELGRLLNANGVVITHNNLMALLRTAQTAVESALGRNVRGQHMLTNSGGLRTRRNCKNRKKSFTRKKRRVRKSKRKRRSMKSKKK